jgi:hypothetical protein
VNFLDVARSLPEKFPMHLINDTINYQNLKVQCFLLPFWDGREGIEVKSERLKPERFLTTKATKYTKRFLSIQESFFVLFVYFVVHQWFGPIRLNFIPGFFPFIMRKLKPIYFRCQVPDPCRSFHRPIFRRN